MVQFSSDIDILKYEPALFGQLHLPWQVLAAGTGASLAGTTLTDAAADFTSASVQAGNVVYLQSADGALDGAYEIVAVDSATELVVSVLRSDDAAEPVAPPQAGDIAYRIGTFGPQAGEAAFQLTEYFGIRPGHPTSSVAVENIVDTEPLRRASVFAVIASVYAMWASRDRNGGLWAKSLHYRQRFEEARQRCHMAIDLGTDGLADVTKVGGAINLLRD